MPDGAFWRRTLRLFAGDRVEVTFLAGDVERRWRGHLTSLEDPLGPLVDFQGERRRLCRWEVLRAVQAAGRPRRRDGGPPRGAPGEEALDTPMEARA
jgi:hypothetical protein